MVNRLMVFVVVSMIVVLVLTDVPDLTVRVDPIFPGVKIESGKPNALWPGSYCSTGFAVQYSKSGGSLGFMIASHCTEPGDWPSRVYQPYYDIWQPDKNYAGYTVDRGTNDAYYETNKSKPDAAVWWVANRDVSNAIPVYLCGSSQQWATPISVVPEDGIEYYGVWKIGFASGCTGSNSTEVITRDPRYAGSVYVVLLDELPIQPGDSGSVVFRWWNEGNYGPGVYILGTIIGTAPQGNPQYTLFQSADYALNYYDVYAYTQYPYPDP